MQIEYNNCNFPSFNTEGGSLLFDIRNIYKFNELIGSGQYGTVRLAHKKNDSLTSLYAIKSMTKKLIYEETIEKIIKEVEILSTLDHPCIIRLLETYNDDRYFHIVMEYAKGNDLFDMLIKKGNFSEDLTSRIIFKILSGLSYCHSKNICHRDIKAENIIFSNSSNNLDVKILDFGLSRMNKINEMMHTVLGTPYYVAPEVLQGNYTEKCDIWSVGVLTYIMLCGEPPFNGKSTQLIFDSVLNKKLDFNNEKFGNVSNEAIDFIKKCLEKDISKRPTAHDLLTESWFHKIYLEVHIVNKETLAYLLQNLTRFKFYSKFQQFILSHIINVNLTETQIKDVKEIFEALDEGDNGVLTKLNLKSAFLSLGYNVENSIISSSISKICQNTINFSDFLVWTADYSKILTTSSIKEAFNYFDVNKDGIITIEDIEFSLLRIGKKILNKNKESLMSIIHEITVKDQISLNDFESLFTI